MNNKDKIKNSSEHHIIMYTIYNKTIIIRIPDNWSENNVEFKVDPWNKFLFSIDCKAHSGFYVRI